jgi:hypothetical protein
MSILGGLIQAGGYALQAKPKTYDAYGLAAAKAAGDAGKRKSKEQEQIGNMFYKALQSSGSNVLPFQQEPFKKQYSESFANAVSAQERGDMNAALEYLLDFKNKASIYKSNWTAVTEMVKKSADYITSDKALMTMLSSQDPEEVKQIIAKVGDLLDIGYDEKSEAIAIGRTKRVDIPLQVDRMFKDRLTELDRQNVSGIPVLRQKAELAAREAVARDLSRTREVEKMFLRDMILEYDQNDVDISTMPRETILKEAQKRAYDYILDLTDKQRSTTYRPPGSGGGRDDKEDVENRVQSSVSGTVRINIPEASKTTYSVFNKKHGIDISNRARFTMVESVSITPKDVKIQTEGYDATYGKYLGTEEAVSGKLGQVFVAPVFNSKGSNTGFAQLHGSPIPNEYMNNPGALKDLTDMGLIEYSVLATIETRRGNDINTVYVPGKSIKGAQIYTESEKDKAKFNRDYTKLEETAKEKNKGLRTGGAGGGAKDTKQTGETGDGKKVFTVDEWRKLTPTQRQAELKKGSTFK